MSDLSSDLSRFLVLVPWLAQSEDGVPAAEVCARLGVTQAELAKLVDQVAFVGTPDGSPDELVDLYLEGDRLHVALPQQFTRAPRFTADELLALLMVLAPLRSAPVPTLSREAEALAVRLLELGSERARALVAAVDDAVFSEGERSEEEAHLALLEQAVREHRVCDAEYYTAGRDALSQRQLHPMLLIERRGAWYVVDDQHKTFKVARFKRLAPSDARFTPPAGFDHERYVHGELFVPFVDAGDGALGAVAGKGALGSSLGAGPGTGALGGPADAGQGVAEPGAADEPLLRLSVRGRPRLGRGGATARLFSFIRREGGDVVLEGPAHEREAFLGETKALLARYEFEKDGHGQG
ncbi:MAG: WYL domain-containing protein [Polyangiales bacterium]